MITLRIHAGTIRIIFFLVLLLAGAIAPANASEGHPTHSANCDIQTAACTQPLGEGTVTLDILPRPVKAMRDLTFQVILKNLSVTSQPTIDLGMPGMAMGPNQVVLHQNVDGAYTGIGVIVRCPSGRTLWEAKVTVPGTGTAAFTFNVIY
jgi:hypothetical protein